MLADYLSGNRYAYDSPISVSSSRWQELLAVEKQNESLRRMLEEHDRSYEALLRRFYAEQSENERLKDANRKLREELDSKFKTVSWDVNQRVCEENRTLKDQVQSLTAHKHALNERIAEREAKIDELKGQVLDIDNYINLCNFYSTKNSELVKKVSESEEKIKNLHEALRKKDETLVNQRNEITLLLNQKQKLNSKIRDIFEYCMELRRLNYLHPENPIRIIERKLNS